MQPDEKPALRSRPLFKIAVAGVLIALVAWLGLHIEWVEKDVDLGYQESARRNRLLAAELFLSRVGIESESVEGLSALDDLPPPTDMVILMGSRRGLSQRRIDLLTRWVELGGRLAIVATELGTRENPSVEDPLLAHFGIQYVQSEIEEAEEAEEAEDWSSDEQYEANRVEEHGSSPDERNPSDPMEFESDPDVAPRDDVDPVEDTVIAMRDLLEDSFAGELPDCGEAWRETAVFARYGYDASRLDPSSSEAHFVSYGGGTLESDLGLDGAGVLDGNVHLLERTAGEGSLVVTTSMRMWTNTDIHCFDHAYLLWQLAEPASKVWILHDPAVPSLASLVVGAFPLTTASALLLVLAGAFAASMRFGPLRAQERGERRELLEHLEATGEYLWRTGQLGTRIDALRSRLIANLQRRHPIYEQLDAAEKLRFVSELTGMAEAEIQKAWRQEVPTKRIEVVQLMRQLQQIERGIGW